MWGREPVLTPALRLGCDLLLRYRRLLRYGLRACLGAAFNEGWFISLGFLLRWRRRYKRGFGFGNVVQIVLAWDCDVSGKGKPKGEAG